MISRECACDPEYIVPRYHEKDCRLSPQPEPKPVEGESPTVAARHQAHYGSCTGCDDAGAQPQNFPQPQPKPTKGERTCLKCDLPLPPDYPFTYCDEHWPYPSHPQHIEGKDDTKNPEPESEASSTRQSANSPDYTALSEILEQVRRGGYNDCMRVVSGTDLLDNWVDADVAHDAITKLIQEPRHQTLQEVLTAIEDMQAAYAETGRTLSKGEIIKWLKYELAA